MRMPPPPILHVDDISLRLATEADAELIVRYYRQNRRHLTPWEPARPSGFFDETFWRLQIRRNTDDYDRGAAVRFFGFRDSIPEVAGYVSLTNITRGAAHFCFLGYSLAHREQGRGLMTALVGRTIEFAFEDLNLHRVMANYMPRNERSARLLERLGFEREGMASKYLLINGNWEDHVMTSLINPNWKPEGSSRKAE